MYKKFYSSRLILENHIFSLFPIVKMNANYAEICRVGNLIVARFSKSSYCSIFLKFSQYCYETSIIQIQQRNIKHIFLDKNSKIYIYYRNYIGQTNFRP